MSDRDERLYRLLQQLKDKVGPRGYYAEAEYAGNELRTGLKHYTKSDLEYATTKFKKDRLKRGANIDWELPPLKKRTERERVESLARRLWVAIQSQPWEAEMLARTIQAEYWKEGTPRSYEEIKVAAQILMDKAAKRAGEKK